MVKEKKQLRTCIKGHKYYKSTDCPVCPVCEAERNSKDNFLSQLSTPARRALENKGITTLKQLSKYSEAEILKLDGLGKSSIPKLRRVLKEASLSFRNKVVIESGKPENIDEYIAGFPKNIQFSLKQLRATIKKAAPEAEEVISYGMPAFKLNGMLLYFAAHKNHIGFYPYRSAILAFKKELSVFKGATGSVQFPHSKPLPLKLVSKMVTFRVQENLNKPKRK